MRQGALDWSERLFAERRATPLRAVALAALAVVFFTGLASAQSLGPPQQITATPGVIARPIAVPPVPSAEVPSPLLQARYQPMMRARPGAPTAGGEESQLDYQIQLEPPGIERLAITMANDATLQERIRQEALGRNFRESVTFPEEPILSRERYYGRGAIWPQRGVIAEPNYVCHGKLLFEDRNAERYGWEIGMLQPFISGGLFFADLALLPCRLAKTPCDKGECSAGHCLPGDPVPFRLYPPEITTTGTLAEAAVILALVVIFP